jgi:multicomponent Na+:H+ antiporter subunit E
VSGFWQDAITPSGYTVKRTISLGIVLILTWLLWSGHLSNPFLLALGACSVVGIIWLEKRMEILDDEGAPLLEFKLISYVIWLLKEIVEANIEVTKLILDPKLPIRPRMICVKASQKTSLGRVILANSITLTPGTVSVDMQGDRIWVHALSFEGAEEDLSGDMDRRVSSLGV